MHLRPTAWSASVLALAFLAWLAFVGDHAPQELVLGAICALFAAAASLLTWRAMGISAGFDFHDVLQLWRVPRTVVEDTWVLTRVLARDLFLGAPAGSYMRAARFEKRKGPRGQLRRVLEVAYTSVSPNSIVLGIDEQQSLMIFHQVERSHLSEASKRLGARE